jgi:hypothetical protein
MGGNIMQRAFQAVAEAGPVGITQAELAARLEYFEPESVRQGLIRLTRLDPPRIGILRRCSNGLRRNVYFVVPGTRPPADRRGRWARKEPA